MSDRHDDIAAAWDEVESDQEAPSQPVDPVQEEPTEPAEAVEEPPQEAPPPEDKPVGRDESGKFTKKVRDASGPPVQGKVPVPPPGKLPVPGEPVKSKTRAPSSWKPVAREKWDALPPEVQEEALRINKEVQQVMQESASVKKQVEAFQQAVMPHAQMLQANGIHPVAAVQESMQVAAQLNSPNPDHAAGVLSQMIQRAVSRHGEQFLDRLINTFHGQAQSTSPAPTQQYQPPQDIRALLRQEISEMTSGAEVKKFLQTEPEFLDDVFPTVLKILEGGLAPNVNEAYNMAIKLNPELSSIVQQREQAKAVANRQGSTSKARAAAGVALRGAPVSGVTGKDANGALNSRRDDIEAAWDEVTGR